MFTHELESVGPTWLVICIETKNFSRSQAVTCSIGLNVNIWDWEMLQLDSKCMADAGVNISMSAAKYRQIINNHYVSTS